MSGADRLLESLRLQGRACAALGSPMYGELLQRVGADVGAGGIFANVLAGYESAPGRLAVPLRLLGGLHRLALDGRAPQLRRWYPSTGGTWAADEAWPQIIFDRSRAHQRVAGRAQPTTADQRSRQGRGTDRRSACARQANSPCRSGFSRSDPAPG